MHLSHRARAATRAALPAAVVAALVLAGTGPATAATTNPSPNDLELANAQLSKRAATEGMVLLENNDGTLPVAKSSNVALFGVGAYATVKGGTGSGNVNNRYTINVRSGLENAGYTITTSSTYWSAMTSAYDTKYPPSTSGSVFGPTVDYSSVEQALTRTSVQPTAPTDTAIFVVARNSGEGADRKAGQGDYLLTDTEYDDIQRIGQAYEHVAVVLNVGGVVDTSFFQEINRSASDPGGGQAVDSLLLMSQAGQESGNALAEVLDGDANPSGKLTDTWASKYSYYPAAATFALNDGSSSPETYSEGVYVGYRYFDSFYRSLDADHPESVVDYPFGYGLSYTNFHIDPQSVTADMDHVTVKAKVTNVGDTYSGKEVVETYFSAPQTGLDKPYQELAGYAKTDDLAPGASQILTITYDTTEMSSYDESTSSYVMDAGDYVVRVGSSSRNTQVAATIGLADRTVTEQDSSQLVDDEKPATELTSDPADFYTYDGEADEVAAAPHLTLSTAGFSPVQAASKVQQDVAVDSTSPYFALDGATISSVPVYLDPAQTSWEGTGAPYAPKAGETVKAVTADPTSTLYDVAKGRTSIEQLVAGLSVTQLANVVEGASAIGSTLSATGAAGYTTAKYESLGIPAMTLSDGPAGLRITQKIATTPATYQFGTAWPVGTALAQTWNRDLVTEVGTAIGKEMQEYGVSLWLAPGMNIHRDPLNGRNFEYYSEDPVVSGLTSAATTLGVQSVPGEGVTIKHFAANNQETQRSGGDVIAGERGLREIELKGFEIAVKSAQPMAVMSSYNKVNGTYAAQNYDLLEDVLRGEWGFKGTVMSDWGGSHDTVATMYAGNDLIEPGNAPQNVINTTVKVPPTIDVSGLPVYNKTVTSTRTTYAWSFNGLTPSATGTETISTTVDGSTDLSKTPASGTTTVDVINNQVFTPNAKFTSVDDAYTQTAAILAGSTLTAAQKAGITLTDVVHADPADATSPVTAYTVVVKGTYPAAGWNMRLGDLQRSAIRVLTTVRQSAQFAQLASIQGVSGIKAASYTAQFSDLKSYVAVTKGKVTKVPSGPAPQFTVTTDPALPASGWYTGPVAVSVAAPEGDIASVSIDGGESVLWTGTPVEVSGDGEHHVLVAVSRDDAPPAAKELTVKIDGAAPTASVTSAKDGKLVLTASDELSGVASVEYSVDGGSHWSTYSGPATIAGAPRAVQYRATDVAGNVSTAKSVTVAAKLALAKPVVTGTPVVGNKLTATVASHTSGSTLGYQWLRNGKAIAGATKSTYTAVAADAKTQVSVKVTATKSGSTAVSSTSAPVTVLGKLVLSTPAIKGSAVKGSTVKATVDTHTSGATLSYQWKRDGKAITGAKASSYKVVKADVGTKLTVTVTESKSGYQSVAKTSAPKKVK
ncbi:glycoside hydrolase family 3 C-terminal domain-containing protein [Cellulomonas sp. JH27-2]|uniref:glycoside hydrolase family 3 C-terminal domain-containing protein n=1 Tax=Cellulomonas sp. JH27-2 TaxID=2774139 RepID=UPI001780C69B|nr:glycoside hydrolase family 3 C-terminal domain-containing protein [Cellulomonas sp. JH27-2]MBD8059724.1 glycoside hydrolase family 3 C-terminal domain-containing protein [Cellulomonas sp. JH27-2]